VISLADAHKKGWGRRKEDFFDPSLCVQPLCIQLKPRNCSPAGANCRKGAGDRREDVKVREPRPEKASAICGGRFSARHPWTLSGPILVVRLRCPPWRGAEAGSNSDLLRYRVSAASARFRNAFSRTDFIARQLSAANSSIDRTGVPHYLSTSKRRRRNNRYGPQTPPSASEQERIGYSKKASSHGWRRFGAGS
jgi:hypothetical protein